MCRARRSPPLDPCSPRRVWRNSRLVPVRGFRPWCFGVFEDTGRQPLARRENFQADEQALLVKVEDEQARWLRQMDGLALRWLVVPDPDVCGVVVWVVRQSHAAMLRRERYGFSGAAERLPKPPEHHKVSVNALARLVHHAVVVVALSIAHRPRGLAYKEGHRTHDACERKRMGMVPGSGIRVRAAGLSSAHGRGRRVSKKIWRPSVSVTGALCPFPST